MQSFGTILLLLLSSAALVLLGHVFRLLRWEQFIRIYEYPQRRSLLRAISKAIMASDVGITPIDDGSTIRLNFPAPTEERRKQLTKDVKKQGEDAKTAVRNIRRDAMDKFKAMKKAGELTEDTQKTMEEDVQKLTDKYVKNIDAAVEEKQTEIMSV